jgi:hypothetical protein
MNLKTDNMYSSSFYKQLFGKNIGVLLIILGVGLLYVILMSIIDHQRFPFPYLILVFAFIKTALIAFNTLKQIGKLIKICHEVNQLLWIFGVLIGISISSFATDFTCLYEFDHNSFSGFVGEHENYIYHLFHFLYFSVITFSTVGYGDIQPISEIARLVVVLEISLSFFIVVFGLANIKNIHLNE